MLFRFAIFVLCLTIPSMVLGQVRIIQGANGPQVVPQTQYSPQRLNTGGIQIQRWTEGPSYPQVVPQTQPQGLIYDRIQGGWVTPNVQTGINKQTLGIDTSNSQVDDSAFAFGREQGKANKRWVRRPVYGTNGQISGYQEGYVWTNPYTGQEHADMKNYTPNNQGGINTQQHSRMLRRP